MSEWWSAHYDAAGLCYRSLCTGCHSVMGSGPSGSLSWLRLTHNLGQHCLTFPAATTTSAIGCSYSRSLTCVQKALQNACICWVCPCSNVLFHQSDCRQGCTLVMAAGHQPWEGCRHRDNAEMVEILSSTLMGIVSCIQSSHCCQQLGCCHRAQTPSKTTNKDQ